MKKIITILALILSANVCAGELNLNPYLKYTNDLNYTNSQFDGDIHHFRFGANVGKFYGEIGPTAGDGRGMGGEVGYNFTVKDRFTFTGSWQGIRQRSKLQHVLETEIVWNF